MQRKKHPKKEIEKSIQYAESKGWRVKAAGGSAHAWARLMCPLKNREGCTMSVWSTPRDPSVHAEQIKRRVDSCPHDSEEK